MKPLDKIAVFCFVLATIVAVCSIVFAQEKAAFHNRVAVAETLASQLGECLSRLEASLTQAELNKVEAAILATDDAEKRAVLEKARTLLDRVKAADALTAVDAELAKIPKEADKPEEDLR
jgi:hypothetical protein